MCKVQIFKNYNKFNKREDKTINGVTQQFLIDNNLTLETLNLIICINCK